MRRRTRLAGVVLGCGAGAALAGPWAFLWPFVLIAVIGVGLMFSIVVIGPWPGLLGGGW